MRVEGIVRAMGMVREYDIKSSVKDRVRATRMTEGCLTNRNKENKDRVRAMGLAEGYDTVRIARTQCDSMP